MLKIVLGIMGDRIIYLNIIKHFYTCSTDENCTKDIKRLKIQQQQNLDFVIATSVEYPSKLSQF